MSAVQSDPKPPKASSVSLRDFGPPEISDKKRCKRAAKSSCQACIKSEFSSFRVVFAFSPNLSKFPSSHKKKRLVPWLYHHVSKKRYLVWGKSTSPMKVSRTLFFLGVKTKQLSLDKTGHTQEFKWWCCLKVYSMSSSKGRSFLACRLNYICVHHTICSKSTQTPWISLSFIPNIYIYVYTWYMLRVYHQFQKHSTFRRGKSSSCHTNIWWVTCIVCI